MTILPLANALLNAATTACILSGLLAIRARRIPLHRACMLSAVGCSVLFLVSYLSYHAMVGTTRFTHPGWPRTLYFFVLGSHTILAFVVASMLPFVLLFALRGNFARHKPLARILAPIWLYVSVTGILVYLFLYRIWPSADVLTR